MTFAIRTVLLFVFCLSVFIQDAGSGVAKKDKQGVSGPDAVLDEKGMNIYFDRDIFLFMLENIPLSVKLAGELGLTEFTVAKGKEGHIFAEPWFKVVLKKAEMNDGERALEFSYLIGFESLLPINSSGYGEAFITSIEEKEGQTRADIQIRLYAGNGMLDEVMKSFPIILKSVFSIQMEKVFRQAEELAVYFRDDAGYILEIAGDEESEFTVPELKKVKNFLSRTTL